MGGGAGDLEANNHRNKLYMRKMRLFVFSSEIYLADGVKKANAML